MNLGKYCAADLETNGLLPEVSTIHILCIVEGRSPETPLCYHDNRELPKDGSLLDGLNKLLSYDTVVFHNGIGFDLPVIKKLYPQYANTLYKKILDSYILSQLLWANQMKKHNLASWGTFFKHPKPAHEDWTQLTRDMIHRCCEDVLICMKLIKYSLPRLSAFPEKALKMEQKVYKVFIEKQSGVYLHVRRAKHVLQRGTFFQRLLENKIQSYLPIQCVKEGGPYARLTNKNGGLTSAVLTWAQTSGVNPSAIAGPFSRIAFKSINLNSPTQISTYLLSIGWVPEEWNYKKLKGVSVKTSPKLSKSSFVGVPGELGVLLKKRSKLMHKLRTVAAWLKVANDCNLIPTPAYTCGTNTGRFRHALMVNVPNTKTFMGKTLRSLILPKKGRVFVGCDAAQLEARVLGHFTAKYDGGIYAKFLLNEDIHSYNAKIFNTDRSTAKTLGYALDYGCLPDKVKSILGCDKMTAENYWNDYWDARPAAKRLINELQGFFESHKTLLGDAGGFIYSIDKRPVFVRSKHSLLNCLIQSSGAVLMKYIYLCINQALENNNLKDARIAIFYHDEFQIECSKADASLIPEICHSAFDLVSKHFKLTVPLVGDVKTGLSWRETH